ncbi:hypothetical protein HNO53_13020 [Billgrantia antri]|uniref:Uncharacterized protein n=1 Tax=Halomonas sulfidivorans TaxID=2733488 RepID=A0ABX7WJ84_9GAMM|nr:hypothetical protein [Halomonas sulfidivorans]QTP59557.1 hypothetical protein HNO53_13020 [Halomonas sulfidivorans]
MMIGLWVIFSFAAGYYTTMQYGKKCVKTTRTHAQSGIMEGWLTAYGLASFAFVVSEPVLVVPGIAALGYVAYRFDKYKKPVDESA